MLPGVQLWLEGHWKEFWNSVFSTGLSNAFIVPPIRSGGGVSFSTCLSAEVSDQDNRTSLLFGSEGPPPSVAPGPADMELIPQALTVWRRERWRERERTLQMITLGSRREPDWPGRVVTLRTAHASAVRVVPHPPHPALRHPFCRRAGGSPPGPGG